MQLYRSQIPHINEAKRGEKVYKKERFNMGILQPYHCYLLLPMILIKYSTSPYPDDKGTNWRVLTTRGDKYDAWTGVGDDEGVGGPVSRGLMSGVRCIAQNSSLIMVVDRCGQ
ncbi:hypothetical protein BIY37_08715 [Candidatus Brocadia sapporoensis]|uniref:Uncharacterized protein n=2 Tax=Candidatus Brocadia sapporoensis TaxID=392547 RepID=A0A1V6LZ27_9BACT|nr:hypothetical protein [Candidatus Brocadia sp.]OQD45393.1 hypothetical protein BIY37_08715 [Candidatus Brocadia sapporoensis]